MEKKNILVLNCGSSSIKYALFDSSLNRIIRGGVERIGADDAYIIFSDEDKTKEIHKIQDHVAAIEIVLNNLFQKKLIERSNIIAVGHRVVHGGEKMRLPSIVNDEVKSEIKKCFSLAPLHNPHHLEGIIATEKLLPEVQNVAVFDTGFYETIPEYAYMYPLPYYLYKKHNIRRYGFHGISHQYVAEKAAEILQEGLAKLKMITCHLGNGCSITAIKNGKAIDTSMGFTPLEGLMMGTRCGDIDPAIVSNIATSEGLTLNQVNNLLNSQSGLYGISGISNDMRTLIEESKQGNNRAQLAIDMFCYRVKKYIGAYLTVLEGIDAIVFTAGIGENSALIRRLSLSNLSQYSIELDENLNKTVKQGIISKNSLKTKILVVQTDESLMIAKQSLKLINKKV